MWDAVASMLPYTTGLLVSPLPVAALILLLVSRGGMGKATVFLFTWLAVSLVMVLGLAAAASAAPPHPAGDTPAWQSVIGIVLGVGMLVLAAVVWRAWQRQRQADGKVDPPKWMMAMDGMSHGKVAGLAVVLIVANPVNASMLIAAAIELGHQHLPAGENLVPAAVFVLIGSLTVIVPYMITLIAGRKAGLLPHARNWLLQNNNMLTFWMTLAFGIIFVIKGLRGLL